MTKSAALLIPTVSAEETERRLRRSNSQTPHLWSLLDVVKDPEIPVVSIWELGVLQNISRYDSGRIVVTITPTYSGCPAIEVMSEEIINTLREAGYDNTEVVRQLTPAWSSHWLLPKAKDALRRLGIAPPEQEEAEGITINCPRCGSNDVACISAFGSTACKALYKCTACAEPFDYFKAI